MKTKRFIILGFMAALITSVMGSLLLPTLAQAATSATWVDQATIDINGVKYKEDDASDSNWNFYGTNPDGGCRQELKGFTNPGYDTLKGPFKTQTVKLHKQKAVAGGCTSDGVEDIQLQANPPGYNVAFIWTDDKNIESADGRKKFSQDAAGNFVSVTDSGACKDFLVAGSDKSQLNLTIRANKGGFGPGELALKYSDNGGSGYPFVKSISPAGDVKINGQDCYESKPVGVAANAVNSARQGTSSVPGASGAGGNDNSCESKDVMGWITCPIIMSLDGIFNWIDTQIQALLDVNEDAYQNDKLYSAWSNIRNIAYIVLIPVMLVMVIGTALGSELFSAYTIKKAIPRMIAATLFISLSWYICMFFISFFNVLGSGMMGLITSPFGLDGKITLGSLFNPSAGGAVTQIVGGGGALVLGVFALVNVNGLLGILLLYFAGAVLTIFVAFLILVIRQMFILALVLAAPLAILAWIFPGNDKMWKWWWGTFSKLLIMFPLITGLIAVGRVFAYLVGNTPTGGVQGGLLNPLLKITAYIIPYILIPMTFKFAGGAFATLTGMVNDRGKGVFDRIRKTRQKGMQQIGHNAKHGNLLRGPADGVRDRMNERVMRLAHLNKAGFNPENWRSNLNTAVQDTERHEREEMLKDPDVVNSENYDDIMRALAVANDRQGIRDELERQDQARMDGARNSARETALARGATEAEADAAGDAAALAIARYRNPQSLDNDVARVERIRAKMGTRAARQMGALQMVKGGTATDDPAEALRILTAAAGGDDAVLMNLVAEYRSAAMAGGRVDQGGASQGVTYDVARRLAAGEITDDEANDMIYQGVIEAQGASVLSHPSMKPRAMNNIISGIQTRIASAIASGDMAEVDREMALVNNIHTSLTNTSPQLADRFGRDVMLAQVNTGTLSQDQRDELEPIIRVEEVVRPARQITRAATDPNTGAVMVDRRGQPVMETVMEPAVTRHVADRNVVTIQEILDARRGSADYSAFTKDYGTSEAARRAAAGGPAPGSGAVPPVNPGP